MTEYPIYDASYEIMRLNKERNPNMGFKPKYPWRELQVGKVFLIDLNNKDETEIKKTLASIQNQSYRKNKLLKRKFKVLYHSDKKIIEVARLSDSVGTPEPVKNVEQTSNGLANIFDGE